MGRRYQRSPGPLGSDSQLGSATVAHDNDPGADDADSLKSCTTAVCCGVVCVEFHYWKSSLASFHSYCDLLASFLS